VLVACLLVALFPAVAQQSGIPTADQQQQPSLDPQFGRRRSSSPEEEKIERDMQKKRNLERQASLKKDTDRLYQLAGELKQYVDKTNENQLSIAVIKKAEEVEKLAKQVKEKMRSEN
jgi:hypothetical protein